MIGCGGAGSFIHWWWECKMITATLGNNLTVSYKVKHACAMSLSWIFTLKKQKLTFHTKIYRQRFVVRGLICNSRKNRWMVNKLLYIHSYNRIIFSKKKNKLLLYQQSGGFLGIIPSGKKSNLIRIPILWYLYNIF